MATALTAAAIVAAGGATAGAATLNAQSVGRFVDGSAGGQPIQSIVDLKDARATAPGTQSQQNPLVVTLGGQGTVDQLNDQLKLPGGGIAEVGAVNQLARASTDGSSLGASGAVSNSGGISAGGDDSKYPADATIDLSASALGSVDLPGLPTTGLPTLPTPPAGLPTDPAAFGGVAAQIGAISGLAKTKAGGDVVTPDSSVASLKLAIGSPAIGALLKELKAAVAGPVLSGLNNIPNLPTPNGDSCAFTADTTQPITFEDGAITVDPDNAAITVDVGLLIKKLLDKDISDLSTSNFDLVSFLVEKLPSILSSGLAGVVTDISDGLSTQFADCLGLFPSQLTDLLTTAKGVLTTGQAALIGTTDDPGVLLTLANQFSDTGASGLDALASGLEQAVDIGLNVQSGPGIEPREKTYPFTTQLAATPDQATAVVDHQTLVRAIEIDLLKAAPAAPNSASHRQIAGRSVRPLATAPATAPVAVLALGNAAVGPGAVAAPTAASRSNAPADQLPTGVPAGQGTPHHGTPILPLVLALLAVMVAGGGTVLARRRRSVTH